MFSVVWCSQALAWTCRNEQFEISCANGKCDKADSFTPMSLSVSDDGRVSACAYSGCWEGRATFAKRSGTFLHISGVFGWTGQSREKIPLAIVIDRKAKTAAFIGANFVNPMTCE